MRRTIATLAAILLSLSVLSAAEDERMLCLCDDFLEKESVETSSSMRKNKGKKKNIGICQPVFSHFFRRAPSSRNTNKQNHKINKTVPQQQQLHGRSALLHSAVAANQRAASEFYSFLNKLESKGLSLAREVDTGRFVVVLAQQREEEEETPPLFEEEEEKRAEEQDEKTRSFSAISNGGRLLLQSGTAGGSLGGSAPLTAPVSSGGGGGARPGGSGARPGGGGGAGGGADPARFGYSGPAVGVTVPNSVARVLPQFPPNFNGTRPVVVTNPLSLLSNGVYQGNIYSGGTSRSPALATVPTPTPPAPAAVYINPLPGDPVNYYRATSGIDSRTNAESATAVVDQWPFNNFRITFPQQSIGSAGSINTLFCATPLTQWCTNTIPANLGTLNTVLQETQNPNFFPQIGG